MGIGVVLGLARTGILPGIGFGVVLGLILGFVLGLAFPALRNKSNASDRGEDELGIVDVYASNKSRPSGVDGFPAGTRSFDRIGVPIPSGFVMTRLPSAPLVFVTMTKTDSHPPHRPRPSRLLHVPQHDLQSQLASRLERLGFPTLRPAHVQLLSAIGPATRVAGSPISLPRCRCPSRRSAT